MTATERNAALTAEVAIERLEQEYDDVRPDLDDLIAALIAEVKHRMVDVQAHPDDYSTKDLAWWHNQLALAERIEKRHVAPQARERREAA